MSLQAVTLGSRVTAVVLAVVLVVSVALAGFEALVSIGTVALL